MNRYLLNISYIGTRFRGIQKSINKTIDQLVDFKSVQGVLEIALKKFKPVNDFAVVLSSRTDAGVHAIQSTVHVDLERYDKTPFNPTSITQLLNRTFYNNNWHIRVLSTFIVPDDFHCRFSAISRTYLYRFAVRKKNLSATYKGFHYVNFIPIEEIDRCFFIQNSDFDIEKAKDCIELFKGRHDFRTFMGKSRDIKTQLNPTYTWRRIDEISITAGKPCSTIISSEKSTDIYDYWDIKIKGKSFLYRQVRRIVAVIIAIAQGKLTQKDCYEMITIPSKFSWCEKATVMAPYGLYLCKVDYDPKGLEEAINKYKELNKLELIR